MQVVVRVRPALGDEVNAAPAVTCSPSQEQVQVITVSAWPACMHLGISAYQYLLQVELPERLGEKPQLPTQAEKATAKAFAFDACVDGRASQVSSRAMLVH